MIEAQNTEPYSGSTSSHDAWVVESIWGHRLESCTPVAMLLEFLGMAEGMHRKSKLLELTTPGQSYDYTAFQSLQLRNILFNNPRMEETLRNHSGDDEAAWNEWLTTMRETASLGPRLRREFSYLRERFDTFSDLVAVVRLLRRIAMEPGSDRSWTTQFIYPIGPAALYEPLGEKGDSFERNRTVFTRTGEIAYLMLTRASADLRAEIADRMTSLFSPDTSRNRLAMRLIATAEPDTGEPKGGTYLPYIDHPAYDRFAKDLLAILKLNIHDHDVYQYIQVLLPFHVYLYALETANRWVGGSGVPAIVCEVLAPRSDLVRKASIASLMDNDALGTRAVRHYLDSRILDDARIREQLESTDLDEQAKLDILGEHLAATCSFKTAKVTANNHRELRQKFITSIERLYRSGTATGITALGRNCGLSSRRGTNRYRYAPTDDLLRVLVLANVTDPLEESQFLSMLHSRYRIAIGPAEAKVELSDFQFDESDFKRNRERLAQHLAGIGLANRLSDACTYIINPAVMSK